MSSHITHSATVAWQAGPTPAFSNPFHDPTTDWQQHEHQAEPVLIQAQRLVDEAGTAELAKQAVDTVAHNRAEEKESFAHQLGFETYQTMVELSREIASPDEKGWRVVAVKGDEWVMWNEHDLPHHGRFATDHEAASGASEDET